MTCSPPAVPHRGWLSGVCCRFSEKQLHSKLLWVPLGHLGVYVVCGNCFISAGKENTCHDVAQRAVALCRAPTGGKREQPWSAQQLFPEPRSARRAAALPECLPSHGSWRTLCTGPCPRGG